MVLCRVTTVKLAFVENKSPNMVRISELLALSAAQNAWANRGPVYGMMRDLFGEHLGLSDDMVAVPVANGGVALEAMARLHAAEAGRPLRWVGSAYSFQNLGRGYFNDIALIDCDAGGLIDIEALKRLDPASYDGIVATNPFGLYVDFSAIAEFAVAAGKVFLIDNASGLHTDVPGLPWQSFSLHHTKPYGTGEGGLALVPAEVAEALYGLLNYGADISERDRSHWFENGKISDISCAFLIDRLEQLPDWGPQAQDQRDRVIELAARCGLKPLHTPQTDIPMTSMPFLSPEPIAMSSIEKTRALTCFKYYRPLAALPRVSDLYGRLVNVPCHKDVASVGNEQIMSDLYLCMEQERRPANLFEKPKVAAELKAL